MISDSEPQVLSLLTAALQRECTTYELIRNDEIPYSTKMKESIQLIIEIICDTICEIVFTNCVPMSEDD